MNEFADWLARVPSEPMNDPVEPLSLGAIVEPSPDYQRWREAIRMLTLGIADARSGHRVPLSLNVVFHVPGRLFKPEFSGVRTGRYSNKLGLLMVQVAVPEVAPEDRDALVRDAVARAIDEAESWAAGRRVKSTPVTYEPSSKRRRRLST